MEENAYAKRLFEAVLLLKTEEECRRFFEDICTIKEMIDISQRLRVAELLSEGKNYIEIAAETGASTATICRVNRCVMYGSGGYREIIARLSKENTDEDRGI